MIDLETTIKYHDWIPVRSPGLKFYCDEIVANRPFSFPRYGEGEWRSLHPDMEIKKQPVYGTWRDEEAQERLRNTLVHYHKHPRYWPAIWHQRAYVTGPRMQQIKSWLKEHDLDIPWHDGRIWRRAIEEDGNIYLFTDALREVPKPVVVVGPEEIKPIQKRFPIEHFITIHRTRCYYDLPSIEDKVRGSVGDGATVCFSAGGVSEIMIHDLFPDLGETCFLIDCGAFWEALVGMKTRPYHKPLSRNDVERLWGK